ncbi:MAG: nitroreductase family deazaflavin-dependent oxidoreductase [Thermomicrobiales bacterium]|nr:nitroreductase family deazaflavin-dependent oxidoreductase [Thermomicrobiales bacterium]
MPELRRYCGRERGPSPARDKPRNGPPYGLEEIVTDAHTGHNTANRPTFDRGRPDFLRRLFFKAPVVLYHGLLADLMRGRCVMLLTTTGRRSGLSRTTGVSFMPLGDNYIVFSGWGVRSDWYRNLLANPVATIQVGRKTLRVRAVPVDDPERRSELMRKMKARSGRCGPPRPARPLLRLTGAFDYEGDLDLAMKQGGALPVIELVPES